MPPSTLSRRGLLTGLGAATLAAASAPSAARAGDAGLPRITKIADSPKGVTLTLELEHAPNASRPTVFVYVPKHYRYSAAERVCMLVHFHGINSSAEEAMTGNQLREQLFDSRQNAILVVPQGLYHSQDCSFGKLEQQGGLKRMLDETVRVLRTREAKRAMGTGAIADGARTGMVALSTHSGGYHGVAACLRKGEVEVTEVYLFDALYADADAFKDWVIRGKGRRPRSRHKLVNYYPASGTTATQSRLLLAELEKAGVKVAVERTEGALSRGELTRQQVVFVQTALGHGDVTWQSNALRDSLFASAFPRHLQSTWFRHARGQRSIDSRR